MIDYLHRPIFLYQTARLKISLTSKLILEDIPSALHKELTETLTIANPKWIENHRMGRWNRGTPKYLKFYEKARYGRLYIPRGYIRQLLLMCKRHGEPYEIEDKRHRLKEVSFQFQGRLKPFQNRIEPICGLLTESADLPDP